MIQKGSNQSDKKMLKCKKMSGVELTNGPIIFVSENWKQFVVLLLLGYCGLCDLETDGTEVGHTCGPYFVLDWGGNQGFELLGHTYYAKCTQKSYEEFLGQVTVYHGA